MDVITNLFAWGQAHWPEIIQGYLAIIGLASVIVKLTPTLKDDDALKAVIKFIGKWIALDKYGPTSGQK